MSVETGKGRFVNTHMHTHVSDLFLERVTYFNVGLWFLQGTIMIIDLVNSIWSETLKEQSLIYILHSY